MYRLALYGHTGAGKSTTAATMQEHLVAHHRSVAVVKLAHPLYHLQQQYYRIAGRDIDFYEQDQLLLESIATHLRRISSTSLVDDFTRRLAGTSADVVINDDLRDIVVDYPALKRLGFKFVHVRCQESLRYKRLLGRADLESNVHSTTTSNLDQIEADIILDNSNSIEALRHSVRTILREVL